MSLISFTPVTDGSTASASGVNTPLSTIYNDYNGGITDANISASAAIAGSKIAPGAVRVKVGTFTISATGSKAVTGVGFTPKLVKFSLLDTSTGHSNSAVGAMDASGNQYSWANNYDGTNHTSYSNTSNCISRVGGANVLSQQAAYTSMDSDGFTINVTTASTSATFAYEAWG